MKKKQQEQPNYRRWIEVFILLAVCGLIFVNSLYLDGYQYTDLSYESGGLVGSSNGYTVEDNTFQYTGDEDSYVQIASVEAELDQMLVAFGNQAEKDTKVTVNYVDNEGNVQDIVTEATWKKGASTVKIDMKEGEFNSFLLAIPCDFTLSRAYYAVENDYRGASKVVCCVGVLLLSLFLTAVIMSIDRTRALVEKAESKVMDWLKRIWEDRKAIGIKALVFLGIILAGVLLSFVASKAAGFAFSGKLAALAGLVGAIAAVFVLFYRNMAKKLEIVGFLVVLLTGSMFSLLEPANVGVSWDDEIHFHNAIRLSHCIDQQISAADVTIINEYTQVALEKKNYTRADQKRAVQLLDELEKSGYYTDSGKVTGISANAAYLPSAIGLAAARGLGLPFHMALAVGRWMNTLLLAILSYLAMKRLKSGKIVVLLIALLPTNIFIAGNYTYDTWLVAWSILGLSAFFGEWQQPDKKMDRWTPWLIGISMYLAVLPKQVYFPLAFIALFLPASKFNSKKQCWLYRGIILASAVFPFITVYLQNIAGGMGSGEVMGDTRGGEDVNAAAQLEYIRTNPRQAAEMMFTFLKVYLNPVAWGVEYMTNMAYFGYSPMNAKFLLGVMAVGALVSRNEGETKFPWWTRVGVLFVYAAIGFIAALSMYVAFTAVGAATVAGCQGRYLMPALFPALYVLSRFSFKTWVKNAVREENINIILLVVMVTGSVWGLWTGCLSLY